MPTSARRLLAVCLIAAGLAVAGAGGPRSARAAAEGEAEPLSAMHRVFAALSVLLPEALDEERFADPMHREAIQSQLDQIADSAGELEAHGEHRDADFAWLSRSLAEELSQSSDAFARGDVDESRYLLLVATRHCVACHSRLPASRDFPLADRVTEKVAVQNLDPRARAHFYTVTRSFDAALTTWEEMFADRSVPPSRIDTGGALSDYLTVAVRVEGDAPRAQRTLERYARRPDVPAPQQSLVEGWSRSLARLGPALAKPTSLPRAHEIVDEGTGLSPLPDGRERLVHDLVASSLLYRWLDEHRDEDSASPRERSEAFYLLGVIEDRSAEAYWVPRTSQHLERAIRLDPKGPWAGPAWSLLEHTTAAAYGGVDGPRLDPQTRDLLIELRVLIEADDSDPADDASGHSS